MSTTNTTEIQGNKNKVDNSQRTINKKKTSKVSIAIGTVVIITVVGILIAVLGNFGDGSSGGGGRSALIGGVWLPEAGRVPWGFPDELEFFSDGTCLCDGIYGDTNNARYSVDGKRLKITIAWDALTYDFEVKGNTLTLSDWEETVIYKRER